MPRSTLRKTDVERALRIYRETRDAARALGIGLKALHRWCDRNNVAWPARRAQLRRSDVPDKLRARLGMDPETLLDYIQTCATPGCAGLPAYGGLCICCASRAHQQMVSA